MFRLYLPLATLVFSLGCESAGADPQGKVLEATDLGPIEMLDVIGGRDGGYSTWVFGRSVWIYGDTILKSADEAGESWHNNSASWTSDTNAADGVSGFEQRVDSTGAPLWLLPYTVEEHQYNAGHKDSDESKFILWPAGVVEDEANDRALVFYIKLLAFPGDFNLQTVGTSIATWTGLDSSPRREIVASGEESTLLFTGGRPHLAAGTVVFEDYVYAYDCSGRDKECLVGRSELPSALEQEAWMYFDGSGWSADWKLAETVFSAHDIVSVHYSPHLRSFIAVYSRPLSNRVQYRTAPRPEGPWSGARDLFTARESVDGAVAYSAVAHAELENDGTQYISYHRGTAPFRSELRLVQVDFE